MEAVRVSYPCFFVLLDFVSLFQSMFQLLIMYLKSIDFTIRKYLVLYNILPDRASSLNSVVPLRFFTTLLINLSNYIKGP